MKIRNGFVSNSSSSSFIISVHKNCPTAEEGLHRIIFNALTMGEWPWSKEATNKEITKIANDIADKLAPGVTKLLKPMSKEDLERDIKATREYLINQLNRVGVERSSLDERFLKIAFREMEDLTNIANDILSDKFTHYKLTLSTDGGDNCFDFKIEGMEWDENLECLLGDAYRI